MSEKKITEINQITWKAIEDKSAKNLPNKPTEQGWSANAIREALYLPITAEKESVLAELKRVITEANNLFTSLFGKLEGEGGLDGRVTANTEALGDLNGGADVENSVRCLIAAAVAGLIGGEQDEDTSAYKTLKTLYDALEKMYTKTEVDTELAKKSAIKVNGEVQTEWDATGVNITNNDKYDKVAVLKKNSEGIIGYAAMQGNSAQASTFAMRNSQGAIHGNTSDSDADTVLVNKDYLKKKLKELTDTLTGDSKTYTDDKIAALVNGAPTTLDTLKEIADAFSGNKKVVEALDAAIGSKVGTEAYNAKVAELEGDMAGKLDAKFETVDENIIRFLVAYPDGSIKAEKIATGGSY